MSEENEEQYDIKDSTRAIGQLYPVLVDKKGRLIDGFHRLEADPAWPVKSMNEIDTDEKLLLARCVANTHRRGVENKELSKWINGLAQIYAGQGFVAGTIAKHIAEQAGISYKTVTAQLRDEFKANSQGKRGKRPSTWSLASQVIKGKVGGGDYGEQLVQRHREEVKSEMLDDPDFRREAARRGLEKSVIFNESKPGKPVKVMVPNLELVRKMDYLLNAQVVDGYIKRGQLACPKCGGLKLVWPCCGVEIADKETIIKYREEIKA